MTSEELNKARADSHAIIDEAFNEDSPTRVVMFVLAPDSFGVHVLGADEADMMFIMHRATEWYSQRMSLIKAPEGVLQ